MSFCLPGEAAKRHVGGVSGRLYVDIGWKCWRVGWSM